MSPVSRRRIAVAATALATLALAVLPDPAAATAPRPCKEVPALGAGFGRYAKTAVFIAHDSRDGWSGYNTGRADERRLPASTFKIPHALIALETGVHAGPESALRWDGRRHDWPGWNQDQTLASAMKVSCVWYFQETARRIGTVRMQAWLDKLAYGNRACGPRLDSFWLDGDLRVSPREQVEFIDKLFASRLPATARSQQLVRDMLKLDGGPGWAMYGKTGHAVRIKSQVGWLVGSVENRGRRVSYAACIESESPGDDFRRMRADGAKAALKVLGVLP